MSGTWECGVVESGGEREPPVVDEWRPIAGPDRPGEIGDSSTVVAYRTHLEDPRDDPTARAVLSLERVHGHARVWIDGAFVGDHDCPVSPVQFEVDPADESEVVIACAPTDATNALEELPALPDSAATASIRGEVTLEQRPATFLRTLRLDPQLADESGTLSVTATVDAGESLDDRLRLTVYPEGSGGGGTMDRVAVSAATGQRTTVSTTVEVRDPDPWWPRPLGEPHRYTVRATLGEHALERQFGFSHIERDEDGYVINGQRMVARGFTLGPDATAADVDRAVAANATLLRAKRHVPPRAVIDACTEAGVLLWQDLPVSDEGFDPEAARTHLETLSATTAHQPSLATVAVRDARPDSFAAPLGSGWLSRLVFRWRAWRANVDREPAQGVADAVEGLDVVGLIGPPGSAPDAASLAVGWRYLDADDIEWLCHRYAGLDAAIAAVEAASAVDEADGPVASAIRCVLDHRSIDPVDTATYQASVLETVVDYLRRTGCPVVIAGAVRDSTPVGGHGILEHDGTPKPAADSLTAAYEPIRAIADRPPSAGTVGVVVANDTPSPIEATVQWTAGGQTGTLTVQVDALDVADAGTIDVPDGAEELTLSLEGDQCRVAKKLLS